MIIIVKKLRHIGSSESEATINQQTKWKRMNYLWRESMGQSCVFSCCNNVWCWMMRECAIWMDDERALQFKWMTRSTVSMVTRWWCIVFDCWSYSASIRCFCHSGRMLWSVCFWIENAWSWCWDAIMDRLRIMKVGRLMLFDWVLSVSWNCWFCEVWMNWSLCRRRF